MLVTQKCQYALKAVLSLARHGDSRRPVKIAQIAQEQNIPYRFLEVILGQLKQGGFVDSRRGNEGGYLLAQPPSQITVGKIVRFIDGPILAEEDPAAPRRASRGPADDPGAGADVFGEVWRQAQDAVYQVFDNHSIADLLARDEALRARFIPNYMI